MLQLCLAGIAASPAVMVARENTAAARSRIMDVDVAAETASLVRSQVLQQVSVALLAQANLQQRIVLDLLDQTFNS